MSQIEWQAPGDEAGVLFLNPEGHLKSCAGEYP